MLGAGGRCWGQRYPHRGVALMGAGGAPGAGRDLPPLPAAPARRCSPPSAAVMLRCWVLMALPAPWAPR